MTEFAMLKLAMSETIEAKPVAKYPRPGIAEWVNGIATLTDGVLILETAITGNDELLGWAVIALIIGSYVCLKLRGERNAQYQESQQAIAGNDFWEAPG